MLQGRAQPEAIAAGCPEMVDFGATATPLGDVQTLHVLCEFESRLAEELLPPALHPTLPGVVGWMVQRVGESPWGAFHLAQTRIECRSGVRPRGYLVEAVVDSAAAAEALASGWGFRSRLGTIRLRRYYDEVRAEVAVSGRDVLAIGLRDPQPLAAADVQYVANMNLARTPRGLRLVQVDPSFALERAERGEPRVDLFDGEAWGVAELEPAYPISASSTAGSMTLPQLRFLCRPEVWAFDGTERL
ncbi:MAG TPA: acetoacetate decarboxylase family protein [Thermoanaerobaculia bacterium]|nr:acetoacetate decarboxylase family protein [Thermoanaerobaculia bacterium]